MLFKEILLYHPGHWKWDSHLDDCFISTFCQLVESLYFAKHHIKIKLSICPPVEPKDLQTTVINLMDGSMAGGSIGLSYLHHEYCLEGTEDIQVDCSLTFWRGQLNEL